MLSFAISPPHALASHQTYYIQNKNPSDIVPILVTSQNVRPDFSNILRYCLGWLKIMGWNVLHLEGNGLGKTANFIFHYIIRTRSPNRLCNIWESIVTIDGIMNKISGLSGHAVMQASQFQKQGWRHMAKPCVWGRQFKHFIIIIKKEMYISMSIVLEAITAVFHGLPYVSWEAVCEVRFLHQTSKRKSRLEKLDLIVWLTDWLITGALYKILLLDWKNISNKYSIEMEINLEEKIFTMKSLQIWDIKSGWKEWNVPDVREKNQHTPCLRSF